MKKKRILIPIVGQGSIIHIIRTGILEKMREFCEPVLLLLWKQDDLLDELKAQNIEVHIMPEYKFTDAYKALRLKINYWYQYFRLKTPSTDIQKGYHFSFRPGKLVLKQKARENLLWLRLTLQPGYIKQLVKEEDRALKNSNTYALYKEWLDKLNGDGIFTVTPFLHEVELVARILKKGNAQLIASIHSFDNVTKRGWPAIFFDNYFVWNKYNKAELERINPAFVGREIINITGAPQFDFHYDESFCWSKDDWLQKLGLPAGKKIILYAGGSANLLPHEPQYVKHLVEGFEKGLIKEDAVILFRCHPLDAVARWRDFIGNSPFLYYDHKPPAGNKLDFNNFTLDDERRLISTLKHTDVHVNICSTMAVDGSVFNKPQIAPYYDEVNKPAELLLRAIYNQEHYLPIVNSGVLYFADTKEKLAILTNSALQNPGKFNQHCQACANEIITYTDGRSSERVIAKLKTLFA